jgi:purine-binding chemotaxis protein CheW|tara:strand:+ start:2485 stop:3045 length:561 start_codon:yes stop_codon:yes gene_type:complete
MTDILDKPVVEEREFLTFLMEEEEYGVDILSVQEIRKWEKVKPIPNAPPYIKGVINLRGDIVPIVDLRVRFHFEGVEYTPTTVVIILRGESHGQEIKTGIVVDAVSDVYKLNPSDIKPAPSFGGASIDTKYMLGMATVKDKMILLIDSMKIIDVEELAEVADIGSAMHSAEEKQNSNNEQLTTEQG